jgi:hypothetical protein
MPTQTYGETPKTDGNEKNQPKITCIYVFVAFLNYVSVRTYNVRLYTLWGVKV